MKQLAFMIALTALGTVGVMFSPFYGVFVYYFFAVLRPQFIWKWSLPEVAWSFYVAAATIGAAVLGLLGAWPVDNRHPEDIKHHHHLTYSHACFGLFAMWVCLTYFTAWSQAAAYPWLLEYLKIFVMYFVGALLIRTINQVWALFLMIGLTLAYICYEVNYLYFVNGYLGIERNGYGGLDNNGAGLMLAMGAPICWYAYEGLRRWWRWFFLLLIPTIIHAVMMTYSRGAMLALVVTLPLLILRSRMKVRLLCGLVIFATIALPVMAGKEIQARFFSIQKHEVDESANLRRQSWAAAYRIALDHPIFGVGIRNSNLFSYHYGADMEGRTIHSQYLQILADNGFVGLGLYLLVIAASWLALQRARWQASQMADNEGRLVRAMSSGLECTLFLFCFGALFLSLEVFELPFLILLMATQLALVSSVDRVPKYEAADEADASDEEELMAESEAISLSSHRQQAGANVTGPAAH